jgi:hypothetical protein
VLSQANCICELAWGVPPMETSNDGLLQIQGKKLSNGYNLLNFTFFSQSLSVQSRIFQLLIRFIYGYSQNIFICGYITSSVLYFVTIHPANGSTAKIGPWPPLLRFRNNILRCEIVSLTTNPR